MLKDFSVTSGETGEVVGDQIMEGFEGFLFVKCLFKCVAQILFEYIFFSYFT